MKRLCLAALLLAFASMSCARDPHSVRITKANEDKLIEEIKDLKGLTVDESRLLFAFEMRRSLASSLGQPVPSMVGKTVGALISEQRELEAGAKRQEMEQGRLATEAEAKQEALASELRKAINLTVFEKGFLGSNPTAGRYQDYITLKCVYENTSGKDIRAFTGSIRFTDLFDKPIYESGLTISDPVKAGQKATWDGSVEYNQFEDSHRALRNSELPNMKITWLPKSIIYADGMRVGQDGE